MQKREDLVRMFWGNCQTNRHNLRNALYKLPSLVKRRLKVTRHEVGFAQDAQCWIDVEEFENKAKQSIESTNVNLREAALALYKGDFLAAIGEVTPEFDDWAATIRSRLRMDVQGILSSLADHWLSIQEISKAVTVLRRSLEIEPCDERALRKLLQFLGKQGEYTAALTLYEQFKRELAVRQGRQVTAETRSLVEQLITYLHKGLPKNPARDNPRTVIVNHDLIGREQEMAELNEMLARDDCHLITLVGMGGIGKTKLARTLYTQNTERFSDGAYFVSLQAIESCRFIAAAIASSMGWQLAGQEAMHVQLLRRMRSKSMLIVLDNFEHLLSEREQLALESSDQTTELSAEQLVRQILEVATQTKIVITSRQVLRLNREWVYPVNGLAYPPPDAVLKVDSVQGTFPAIELFATIARQADYRFSVKEHLSAITDLCTRTQGLPLAIELVASRLRNRTCAELAAELKEGWLGLVNVKRDIPPRHRGTYALVEWSWQLLEAGMQTAFVCLSIFRESFTESAAVVIAGTTPAMLTALIDKSLLSRFGEGRYQMHELIRQFAEQKRHGDPLLDQETITRYVKYYADRLSALYLPMISSGYSEACVEIDHELPNIRCILNTHNKATAKHISAEAVLALGHYYEGCGHFQEAERTLKSLLICLPEESEDRLKGAICSNIGKMLSRFGRYEKSESMYLLVLKYTQNFSVLRKEALSVLGTLAFVTGRIKEAEKYASEAVGSYRPEDPDYYACVAHARLGILQMYHGVLQQARDSFEVALKYAYSSSISMVLPNALGYLAEAEYKLGKYTEAVRLAQKAVELCRKNAAQGRLPFVLGILAMAEAASGELELASNHYHEALAVATKTDELPRAIALLIGVGQVEMQRGQKNEAQGLLEQALLKARDIKSHTLTHTALIALADHARKSGEITRSCKYLNEALLLNQGQQWSVPVEIEALILAIRLRISGTDSSAAKTAWNWITTLSAHPEITPPLKRDADLLAQEIRLKLNGGSHRLPGIEESSSAALVRVRSEVLHYLNSNA